MKKILYFTTTYICIGLFLIFLPSLDINFWLWLAIGITLLILPIIGVKILKNNYNISKEAILAISSLLFSSIFVLIFNIQKPQYDLIAVTSSIQKASEIQNYFQLEIKYLVNIYLMKMEHHQKLPYSCLKQIKTPIIVK